MFNVKKLKNSSHSSSLLYKETSLLENEEVERFNFEVLVVFILCQIIWVL